MDFAALLDRFSAAACRGDGAGVAECFTPDGVYHDVFYGDFHGRAAIVDMVENHFHRDGEDFRWDIFSPVADGDRGYARYLFSYRSRLPEAAGRRSIFEGVVCARLSGGLIAEHHEVASASTGLALMGVSDARQARFAARQAEALKARPEAARHL